MERAVDDEAVVDELEAQRENVKAARAGMVLQRENIETMRALTATMGATGRVSPRPG